MILLMQDSIRIVHEHHEWHDDTYPRKLKEKNRPSRKDVCVQMP
jgi:response regulator RpfG family c-di-GMP phosphodiesterase